MDSFCLSEGVGIGATWGLVLVVLKADHLPDQRPNHTAAQAGNHPLILAIVMAGIQICCNHGAAEVHDGIVGANRPAKAGAHGQREGPQAIPPGKEILPICLVHEKGLAIGFKSSAAKIEERGREAVKHQPPAGRYHGCRGGFCVKFLTEIRQGGTKNLLIPLGVAARALSLGI